MKRTVACVSARLFDFGDNGIIAVAVHAQFATVAVTKPWHSVVRVRRTNGFAMNARNGTTCGATCTLARKTRRSQIVIDKL